jgi:hypothetical protein
LVALGAGCSSTPKTIGPCHHVVVYPPPGGAGYVAAYDWDDKVHAYGESVPFTACLSGFIAVAEVPTGVTVDPAQKDVRDIEFGVVTFTVTVPEGSGGPIFVRLDYTDGGTMARPPGPVIIPSGDGWKFTAPDMS